MRARPEVEGSQARLAVLPADPGRTERSPADVELMFDPPRDLCLRLAPRDCPARANLAFVPGGSGHTQGRKRGEGGLRARSPPLAPHLALSQGLPLPTIRSLVLELDLRFPGLCDPRNLGKGVDRQRGFEAEQREASLELECQEALE